MTRAMADLTVTRVLAIVPPRRSPTADDALVSLQADDDASARLLSLVVDAGIDPALVLPLPAVPYPLDGETPLTMTDTKAGRAALAALVPQLPRLRSVVLHGKEAETVWTAFTSATRTLPPGIRVEPATFATSDDALAQHRKSRLRRLADTYASVAEALR